MESIATLLIMGLFLHVGYAAYNNWFDPDKIERLIEKIKSANKRDFMISQESIDEQSIGSLNMRIVLSLVRVVETFNVNKTIVDRLLNFIRKMEMDSNLWDTQKYFFNMAIDEISSSVDEAVELFEKNVQSFYNMGLTIRPYSSAWRKQKEINVIAGCLYFMLLNNYRYEKMVNRLDQVSIMFVSDLDTKTVTLSIDSSIKFLEFISYIEGYTAIYHAQRIYRDFFK